MIEAKSRYPTNTYPSGFYRCRISKDSNPPSTLAQPSNYFKRQAGPNPLRDGRYSDSTKPIPVAAPIEIFHPAFAGFKADMDDLDLDLPEDYCKKVGDFMTTLSQITRSELERQKKTRGHLQELLGMATTPGQNSRGGGVDHQITLSIKDPAATVGLALIEEKEIGSGNDGMVQASFYYVDQCQESFNSVR